MYAIEAIFRGLTLAIDTSSLPLDQLAKNLLDKVDFASIKKDFDIRVHKGTPINEFLRQIGSGKKDETFDRFCNLDSKINEEKIFQSIRGNLKNHDYNYFIIYPLILLGLTYLRLNYYRENKLPYWEFGKIGGRTNFSMDVFFEIIDTKIKERASLEDFLSIVIREYIVMQHNFVAIAKLSWYRNDTFHFSNDNGILRGLRIADVNINAPKFRNVLNILADLGLIEEKENTCQLTKRGKEILGRI